MSDKLEQLKNAVAQAINGASLEGRTNTPDFILADHMVRAMVDFERSITARDLWGDVVQSPARHNPDNPHREWVYDTGLLISDKPRCVSCGSRITECRYPNGEWVQVDCLGCGTRFHLRNHEKDGCDDQATE